MIIDKIFSNKSRQDNNIGRFIGYDKNKKSLIVFPSYNTDTAEDLMNQDMISSNKRWINQNFYFLPITNDIKYIHKLWKSSKYKDDYGDWRHVDLEIFDKSYIYSNGEFTKDIVGGYEKQFEQIDNAVMTVIDSKIKDLFDFSESDYDRHYWIGGGRKVLKLDSVYRNKNLIFEYGNEKDEENYCLIEEINWPGLVNSELEFRPSTDGTKIPLNKLNIGNNNSLDFKYDEDYDHRNFRYQRVPDLGNVHYKSLTFTGYNLSNIINKLNTDEIIIGEHCKITGNINISGIKVFKDRSRYSCDPSVFSGVKNISITASENIKFGLYEDISSAKKEFSCKTISLEIPSQNKDKQTIESIKGVSKIILGYRHNFNLYVNELEIDPSSNTLIFEMNNTWRHYDDINIFIKKLDYQNRKGINIKCPTHINVYLNGKLLSNKQLNEKTTAKEVGKSNKVTNILDGKKFSIVVGKLKNYKTKSELIADIQLNGGKVVNLDYWNTQYLITDDVKNEKVKDIKERRKSSYNKLFIISEKQFMNMLNPKTKVKSVKGKGKK